MNSIPNILTILRIIIIPILIFSFYIPGAIANIIVATLFLTASITDFFDGYLARTMNSQSKFGECFDPIADKLLVSTAIIMLIHFSNRDLYITIPGIIIICREIIVSGLREFLSQSKISIPVSKLSKYKTAIQMIAITFLLIGEKGSEYALSEIFFDENHHILSLISIATMKIGKILFFLAAALTVITGYAHFKSGIFMTKSK